MELFATDGDIVIVHYQVTFTDGKVYDSTAGKEPIKFELGSGFFVPGFEAAIRGMRLGEKKVTTIRPVHAFGKKRPELIQTIPRAGVPTHIPCQEGQKAEITLDDGQRVVVTITEVTHDTVTLDANPDPIGKELVLAVELIGID